MSQNKGNTKTLTKSRPSIEIPQTTITIETTEANDEEELDNEEEDDDCQYRSYRSRSCFAKCSEEEAEELNKKFSVSKWSPPFLSSAKSTMNLTPDYGVAKNQIQNLQSPHSSSSPSNEHMLTSPSSAKLGAAKQHSNSYNSLLKGPLASASTSTSPPKQSTMKAKATESNAEIEKNDLNAFGEKSSEPSIKVPEILTHTRNQVGPDSPTKPTTPVTPSKMQPQVNPMEKLFREASEICAFWGFKSQSEMFNPECTLGCLIFLESFMGQLKASIKVLEDSWHIRKKFFKNEALQLASQESHRISKKFTEVLQRFPCNSKYVAEFVDGSLYIWDQNTLFDEKWDLMIRLMIVVYYLKPKIKVLKRVNGMKQDRNPFLT